MPVRLLTKELGGHTVDLVGVLSVTGGVSPPTRTTRPIAMASNVISNTRPSAAIGIQRDSSTWKGGHSAKLDNPFPKVESSTTGSSTVSMAFWPLSTAGALRQTTSSNVVTTVAGLAIGVFFVSRRTSGATLVGSGDTSRAFAPTLWRHRCVMFPPGSGSPWLGFTLQVSDGNARTS